HRSNRKGAITAGMLIVLAAAVLVSAPAYLHGRVQQQVARADSAVTYDVGGIQVIQRRQAGNNDVASNLYQLGGNRQHTNENAGLEAMLLEVTAFGTRTATREVLQRRLA